MNRREFLKLIGVGAAAVVAPQIVWAELSKYPPEVAKQYRENWGKFDPNAPYGQVMYISRDWSEQEKKMAMARIDQAIACVVPPEYRHKIIYLERDFGESGFFDPFNEISSFSWKYTP